MNKKYHVYTSGYTGYAIMSEKELRQFVKDETISARRYFSTAVCHKTNINGKLYFDIVARKDINSARWLLISATPH